MSTHISTAEPETFGIPTVGHEIASTVYEEEIRRVNHQERLKTEQTVGQAAIGGFTGLLGGSIGVLIARSSSEAIADKPLISDKLSAVAVLGITIAGAIKEVRDRRRTANEINALV